MRSSQNRSSDPRGRAIRCRAHLAPILRGPQLIRCHCHNSHSFFPQGLAIDLEHLVLSCAGLYRMTRGGLRGPVESIGGELKPGRAVRLSAGRHGCDSDRGG